MKFTMYVFFFILVQVIPLHAYIDPGTGSMLFSFITGIAVTLFFLLKNLLIRLKGFSFHKDKNADTGKKELVIYSEGKQYWPVFESILKELADRGISFSYYSSGQDDPGLGFTAPGCTTRFIGKGNAAWRVLNFLEADTVLCTTPGLDVLQFKRSPGAGRYIHLLHAVTDATLYRLFGLDYFDAVLLTGPYQETQLRELEARRGTPKKELPVCGCTYLDRLARKAYEEELQLEEKTLLLAPSWGENGILRRFGLQLLEALAASSWHIIIRPHPQSSISEKDTLDTLMEALKDRSNIEWNFDTDNFTALARSRLLVSDFSGIIFDFAFLFGRPVVYPSYTFDPRPYDAADCDEEAWTFKTLGTIGRKLEEKNFSEIDTFLQSVIEDKDRSTAIEQARREAWAYPGESAKKVVDYLVKGKKDD